jgi:hypothetical protein
MQIIVSLILAIYDCILGFVALFIGERQRNNHRGYQSFVVQKTSRVSLQLKLSKWMSLLQHSPTVQF